MRKKPQISRSSYLLRSGLQKNNARAAKHRATERTASHRVSSLPRSKPLCDTKLQNFVFSAKFLATESHGNTQKEMSNMSFPALSNPARLRLKSARKRRTQN
jgi:hypothetical protein